jgi:hypothetical protein
MGIWGTLKKRSRARGAFYVKNLLVGVLSFSLLFSPLAAAHPQGSLATNPIPITIQSSPQSISKNWVVQGHEVLSTPLGAGHPLDFFGILDQTVTRSKDYFAHSKSRLKFQLRDDTKKTLGEPLRGNQSGVSSISFRGEKGEGLFASYGRKGEEFLLAEKVVAAAVIGDFLIYVSEDGFHFEEKKQAFQIVDLRNFSTYAMERSLDSVSLHVDIDEPSYEWEVLDQTLFLDHQTFLDAADLRAFFERKRRHTFYKHEISYSEISFRGQKTGDLFELIYRGEVFYRFHFAVEAAIYFNGYLIFWKEDEESPSFIDLKSFEESLGVEELPIFRLSLPDEFLDGGRTLSQVQDTLVIGGHAIPEFYLEFLSEVQQTGFRSMGAVLNSGSIESLGPLIQDIAGYGARLLTLYSEEEGELLAPIGFDLTSILGDFSEMDEVVRGLEADSHKAVFAGVMERLEDRSKWTQEILKRIQVRWSASLWQWNEFSHVGVAGKIKEALAFVTAGYFYRHQNSRQDHRVQRKEESKTPDIFKHPYVKRGAVVVGAAFLGMAADVSLLDLVVDGFYFSQNLLEGFWAKVKDLGILAKETTQVTVSGAIPEIFYDVYLSEGRRHQTLVGVTAVLTGIFGLLGALHVSTNAFRVLDDLKKEGFSEYRQQYGVLGGLKQFFIKQQDGVRTEYLETLVEREERGRESWEPDLDYEARAQEAYHVWKAQFRKSPFLNLKKAFAAIGLRSKEQIKEALPPSERSPQSIETLWQATKHFLFSWASTSHFAFKALQGWIPYFVSRHFVWDLFVSPGRVFTYLRYPHFLDRSIRGEDGLRLPSVFNGGLRSFGRQWQMRLFNRDQLRALREWENTVQPLEEEIHHAVWQETIQKVPHLLKKKIDLQALYDQGGPQGLSKEGLNRLTPGAQEVVMGYYEVLSEETWKIFLRDLSGSDDDVDVIKSQTLELISNEEWKKRVPFYLKTATETSDIESTVHRKMIDREIFFSRMGKDWLRLDPKKSKAIQRIMVAKRMAKDPKAAAMLGQDMIISNLIGLPLKFLFTLAGAAALTGSIFNPIQDSFMSDTSLFYVSTYFVSTFFFGALTSILGRPWVKAQMDDFNQEEKLEIPSGSDSQLGYWSYLLKRTFLSRDNSWWGNQKHYYKVRIGELPAMMSSILLFNYIGMGHLGVDFIASWMLMMFLIPTSGFEYQIQNGLEKAKGWFLKDVPEEFRNHEFFLEEVSRMQGTYRGKIYFMMIFLKDVYGQWFGNFQNMTSEIFGKRAFLRILFGHPVTVHLLSYLNQARESWGHLPGVNKIAGTCEYLLNNRNDGLDPRDAELLGRTPESSDPQGVQDFLRKPSELW